MEGIAQSSRRNLTLEDANNSHINLILKAGLNYFKTAGRKG